MTDLFGVTNIYLNTTLLRLNLKYYRGVYAVNKIPSIRTLKDNFCIIINTAPDTQPGEHWVAVTMYKKKATIFDSMSIPDKHLSKSLLLFLKKINAKKYNHHQIQSLNSKNCGFYCIHAIVKFHLKLENKSFSIKLHPFSKTSLIKNDEICISNLEKMIPLIMKK